MNFNFIKNVCQHKQMKAYIALSILFMIYSMLTITNEFPWMDEVMFIDPVVSYVNTGEWSTHAWEGSNSWYLPLYQSLMLVWIKLFGFSLEVCRSLNLLLMFLLGGTCLKIMQTISKENISPFSVALYTTLFWNFEELAWMSRNGRVDILGALLAFVLIYIVVLSFQKKRSNITLIVVVSFLLMLAGLQAAVFIVALYVFFILLFKQCRAQLLKSAIYTMIGFTLAMGISLIFMNSIGNLKPFIMSFVSMSATLSKVYYQYIRPVISSSEPATFASNGQTDFLARIEESYSSIGFLILISLSFMIIIFSFFNKMKIGKANAPFILFVISLYIPLFLNFAGRYAEYYRWMCYIPIIMAVILWFTTIRTRILKIGITFICMLISIHGVTTLGKPGINEDYKQLEKFVDKQKFQKHDRIATMWSTFYIMKPKSNELYFYCRPLKHYTKDIDYIMSPIDNGRYVSRYFYSHETALECMVEMFQKDKTLSVIKVDDNKELNVKLYSINRK